MPEGGVISSVVLCKWFRTYNPCKCKSHNDIYLHFV
jgi:hypothetical protein